ncbi:TetR/AcrR family transcriptional regulator [Mycobacterium parmense]|uniref:Putative HTH-type transcriptional regulator n=1 Tax=Mycobacterium parmense TaxID=185642 RepID=A0A7I7YWE1_9MYCO|nr:TetR/AcrR family transcriptional regulator [Mycobacterium parmense]MCV7351489.1 TetR/AcrR family transcriptional regulator [Mycobacterium parmense]ORW57463.1 TetR family transcriptional regulator [Mycobacterium parmense]BBZ45051.1 putative HTH-type transcriptional regulator [Mycobacterium parmense]
MARTQQQRREETVARLLDACIATIIEVGYARASAAVISKRAGVSVGALFRHFETMGDFMAATASEVLRRQLEAFTKRVAEIPAVRADQPALQAALAILRDITAGPANAVLYELLIAARTDEKLRATLQHELGHYSAKILDAARALPGAQGFPEDTFPVLVTLITNVFDGAAVVESVLPQPDIAQRRVAVLTALLTAWQPEGAAATATRCPPRG